MSLLDVDLLPERCVYYETLRGVGVEIERITGRKRNGRHAAGQQHANIVRVNDFHLVHGIREPCSRRRQFDDVADCDILQSPERAVSMTGNSDVTCLSGFRRSHNPSRTSIKSKFIRSRIEKHTNLELNK